MVLLANCIKSKRRPFRLSLLLAMAVLSYIPWDSPARGQSASEYHVKALFLYNFAKFVDWPADASGGPQDGIALCVVGDDPFGSVLDETLKGKTINGQEMVVKRFRRAQDARACQIVFIASSEKNHLRLILESLKGARVLTVGETEGFAQFGGVINFTLEENRVRFEVNVDAADRAGLKISSKLLSLARIVKDGGHGGRS